MASFFIISFLKIGRFVDPKPGNTCLLVKLTYYIDFLLKLASSSSSMRSNRPIQNELTEYLKIPCFLSNLITLTSGDRFLLLLVQRAMAVSGFLQELRA